MTEPALAPITAPVIDYAAVAPLLLVLGAGVLGVVVEAFVPAALRARAQFMLAVGTLVAALVTLVRLGLHGGAPARTGEGAIAVDGPGLFLQGTLVVLALLCLCLVRDRGQDAFAPRADGLSRPRPTRAVSTERDLQTEVFPLLLFSTGGLMLTAAAGDLLTLFVALEVVSLPLYLLCGLARRRRLLSQEASLKYFLLGSFAAGFFLYGTALVYGAAGSVTLDEIGSVGRSGDGRLLLVGMGLVCVALLFKIGAVPFHAWTPDVYQGAPTPITAFMAALTKVGAVGALVRVLHTGFGDLVEQWRPIIGGVAAVTMLAGVLLAVVQQTVMRLLAFSAVAHAGFLLTALSATGRDGVSSVLFYLAVYGIATVGAFAVVGLVHRSGEEATTVASWAGLGRASPVLAGAFALFLLAFAGIPLTSGFVGKFAVFSAAMGAGATTLVVLGVLASAIAAVFYARFILIMFCTEPDAQVGVMSGNGAKAVTAVAAAFTLVVGILPGPVLALTQHASGFVR